MKIGDIVNVRIPLNQHVDCQNGCCARAIQYRNGIPFCRECWLAEQQKPWEDEGLFFTTSNGERFHYTIIRQVTAVDSGFEQRISEVQPVERN